MAATGYGLTSVGFYAKPLSVIDDEIDAGMQELLGESAGTDGGKIPTESAAGQFKAFLVDREAAMWDIMEAIYAAMDPNQAVDASQDLVCSIVGVRRLDQQYSVATGIMTGDALTQLEAGRVALVDTTGSRFLSQNLKTLEAADPWAALASYTEGDVVSNNEQIFRCITSGVAGSGVGPSGPSSDITDGSAHWFYCGEGLAFAVDPFVAETIGAIGALTGKMTGIGSPVSGWLSITNPLDAQVGREKETSAALRQRRDQAVASAGNTTVEAIRANLLAMNQDSEDPNHAPADAVHVYYNDTDFDDANGLPPHSVECVVQGGTDADIAQTVWESVGAGTYIHGSTVTTVTDSEGRTQTVRYTRPTEVEIYVTAVGKYDQSEWPANSDDAVAQLMLSALLTYTEDFSIGKDVRTSPLGAAMMRGRAQVDTDGAAVVPAAPGADPVPGLLEVESLYIGTSPSPGAGTQITITQRQIAVFDSARCDITASAEEP